MGKNFAAKYKKVRILGDFYIYVFIKVLENVEYDYIEEKIIYYKGNKRKTLYDMENPYFTISDENYCFSDLQSLDNLIEMYGTEDLEEIKELYERDCKSFLRYGVFDEFEESVKIVNTQINSILEAEPDSNFLEYFASICADYSEIVSLPVKAVENIIKKLQNDEKDELLDLFKEIIDSVKQAKMFAEEQMKDENNKKEERSLESLIGLDNIKKQVLDLKDYLKFLNKVKDCLNLEQPNLNMVFSGNPGTGKTTIARILGKYLYELGYVKKDIFKETTAQDFIEGYVGQTAIKSKKLLDENRGGLIFIDEAYVFASKAQSYAQEALVEILKELEKKETVFIFAGYKDEMKEFIDMNPGLQSRIGYYYNFKDYSLEELMDIFLYKIEKAKINITEEAKEKVKIIIDNKIKTIEEERQKKIKEEEEKTFDEKYEEYLFDEREKIDRNSKFGNGRFIDKLYDRILFAHAVRLNDTEDIEALSTITMEDLENLNLESMDLIIEKKQKIKTKEIVKPKIGFLREE